MHLDYIICIIYLYTFNLFTSPNNHMNELFLLLYFLAEVTSGVQSGYRTPHLTMESSWELCKSGLCSYAVTIGIIPHQTDILIYPITRHLWTTQSPREANTCTLHVLAMRETAKTDHCRQFLIFSKNTFEFSNWFL